MRAAMADILYDILMDKETVEKSKLFLYFLLESDTGK